MYDKVSIRSSHVLEVWGGCVVVGGGGGGGGELCSGASDTQKS